MFHDPRNRARRPVSRVLSRPCARAGGDGHSSWTPVTERLMQPTRAATRRSRLAPETCRSARRSYLVLLPVGFSLPSPLPSTRCALTAPFHPCRPPSVPGRAGGIFSVALSLGSPPPGVTRHRTSVEPGLSSSRTQRKAAIRPSGITAFGDPRSACQRPTAHRTCPDRGSTRNPDQHCATRIGFYNCRQPFMDSTKRRDRRVGNTGNGRF
jgi:hypothetical protein